MDDATHRNEEHRMSAPDSRREKQKLSGQEQPEDKADERLEKNFGLADDETRKSLTRGRARVKENKVHKENRRRWPQGLRSE